MPCWLPCRLKRGKRIRWYWRMDAPCSIYHQVAQCRVQSNRYRSSATLFRDTEARKRQHVIRARCRSTLKCDTSDHSALLRRGRGRVVVQAVGISQNRRHVCQFVEQSTKACLDLQVSFIGRHEWQRRMSHRVHAEFDATAFREFAQSSESEWQERLRYEFRDSCVANILPDVVTAHLAGEKMLAYGADTLRSRREWR